MRLWEISRKHIVTLVILFFIIISSFYIRSEYVRDGGRALLAYDPYYHYRMAETIVEEGHRPEWDYMASWPTGQPGTRHPPLYHYFLAYTFKVFGGLVGNDLLVWCAFSCMIPVILFVILAFFSGREICDTKGGLFSALLIALAAGSVRRTLLGYADTDGLILVFSFLISFFWIKSLSESRIYYSALTGFSVFLFELTWVGYWHMLFLVIGASGGYVIIHYFREKEIEITRTAVLFLAFMIPHTLYGHHVVEGLILAAGGGAFLVFRSRTQLISALLLAVCAFFMISEGLIVVPFRTLQYTESFVESRDAFYPYVGSFISQRQDVTFTILVQSFTIMLVLAPLGLYLLLRERSEKNCAVFIFLILYSVGAIFMSFYGVRYLLQVTIPVALSSSIALSFIWGKLAGSSPGRKTVALICIIFLMVPVYFTAERENKASATIEGSWWDALQWIKENTPEDSVVISDWGNGYWIESIAKRKSIMNGGHYDLYWRILKFGKIMETTDESIAVKEVFGFSDISEVRDIRTVPEGRDNLLEKEMRPFAREGQDAYIIVGMDTARAFQITSIFGTWDYTTGKGEPQYVYGTTPIGTIYRPHWKEHHFNAGEFQVVVYETEREVHSYVLKGDSIFPSKGTIYSYDGKTYFLKREEGAYGVALYFTSSQVLFAPDDALDSMIVRLFFFNGDGLGYHELVADFGTVKVFKIHREFQETLNTGVIVKEDEWSPA
jgi:dolichyl-diphosphooligosaccharide--protein glycosyltransferase